ncbi:DUF6345 domain-containing protein [Microbacterium sp. C7(2022)]|uniref:DUF6345 domain-containing protein n=1 Tax=Microbacterium sp. C7(2022) TaxID=2992759 RepID=UPI00237B7EB0|nr:DUF6345 domain-containing protein [Microbacterium sp. C7(2022)]MDE0546576.1 DUF6345 domain-containing protein [Microbacterium sp. C7(2022)]
MAKSVGSWWIKDGVDGRRIEAQGFASTLSSLSQFTWTHDHGDDDVLEQDFTASTYSGLHSDQVDAMQMSSHGSPSGFSVWDGTVSTSDAVDFGKYDLEFFATHACQLLRHTSTNSVGRWIPAFQRLHYMLGFHTNSWSGGGQNARGEYFAKYAAYYFYWSLSWIYKVDIPVREAWAEANEQVEGSQAQWAYLRASAPGIPTYNEKLRVAETTDPVSNRSFFTNRGTC